VLKLAELREERTNLVTQLKHVNMALSAPWKLERRKCAEERSVSSGPQENEFRTESTLGEGRDEWCQGDSEAEAGMLASRRKIAAAQWARWAKLKGRYECSLTLLSATSSSA
jgi:hypothetical protein